MPSDEAATRSVLAARDDAGHRWARRRGLPADHLPAAPGRRRRAERGPAARPRHRMAADRRKRPDAGPWRRHLRRRRRAQDLAGDGRLEGPARRAQLPLLDRLVDADPGEPTDRPLSSGAAMTALRASVCNDLEELLNTRRRWRSWDPHYTELERS